MSDEIDKLKSELEAARRQSVRLHSENTRLKAMLEAFALRPAAALEKPPLRSPSEQAPNQKGRSNRTENGPTTVADERILLFRMLFRGRQDVYAVRWARRKSACMTTLTARSRYSCACLRSGSEATGQWDTALTGRWNCHKRSPFGFDGMVLEQLPPTPR